MPKSKALLVISLFAVLAAGFAVGFAMSLPRHEEFVLVTNSGNQLGTNILSNVTNLDTINGLSTENVNVESNTNTNSNPVNSSINLNASTGNTNTANTNTSVNKNTSTNKNTNKNKNTNQSTNTNRSTNTNQSTNTNTAIDPLTQRTPNEKRFYVYNTGYGWPDNTPPGGAISNPAIHTTAGGTGTYQNPITLAVGHSIIGDDDILDYPQGTRFYIPALRRYFIVEDTCGDGDRPQDGPCHKSEVPGKPQLDLWVGGQGASNNAVYDCESHITGVHFAIQNPATDYVVVSGPIYNNGCSQLYGDTVVVQ